MIFASHGDGDFYENITFALAKNRIEGHANNMSLWACRDNGAGDSLGEQRCGGGPVPKVESDYGTNIDVEHPTFKRMVKWLKSQDIFVTVWDGEIAVPLDDFLAEKK